MKKLKTTLALLAFATLFSCGSSSSSQPANAEGFAAIQKDLESKFTADAFYTDLTIMYNETIGNSVVVTATEDPASLKMGEWTQSQGDWMQTSEVTLELPEGTKAEDFMFQLKDKISLRKMGELVVDAQERLTKEKSLENPKFTMATVMFPDTGEIEKAKYSITLEPETGGTSFSFYYALDGSFLEMDY